MTNKRFLSPIISFTLLIVFFLIFSSLFVFKKSNLFPILNGIIMVISLFIYKGKYRIYSLAFFINFTKCMIPTGINVGSFLTWCILIYFLIVFIDYFTSKKVIKKEKTTYILSFCLMFIFSMLSYLINFNSLSIFKLLSCLLYLSIPLICSLDFRASKNIGFLVFIYSFSLLLSNFFLFGFTYFNENFAIKFLETYIPNYTEVLLHSGIKNFRFPGLIGDSNHLGLTVLFSSFLQIVYLLTKKKNFFIHIVVITLNNFFAIIGGSKTYLISLFFIIIILFIYFAKRIKLSLSFISLIIFVAPFLLILVSQINVFMKPILRLINVDIRIGFLESFTTQRASIWENFLSNINTNPVKLLFGHGLKSGGLFGKDFHNLFIQILWEFGLIGIPFYLYYLKNILSNLKIKTYFLYLIPFILILVYGLTLHILFDELVYLGLFIYNLMLKNVTKESEVLI